MTTKPRRAAEPVTGLLNQTALDDATLNQLREWDPRWAEVCQKISTSPLIDGVLPRKLVELIGMAASMGWSQYHPEEIQRHIRAAVEAGAARDEIPMVLKMATLTSIRSISIGTKILVKEASMEELDVAAIGRAAKIKKAGDAPASVNKIKAAGLWNEDWEQVYFLAPVWLEEFMMATISVYESGVLTRKDIELLNVAFEVSRSTINGVEMKRKVNRALRAGATVDEIMEIYKVCVAESVQACNLVVPILAAELAHGGERPVSV